MIINVTRTGTVIKDKERYLRTRDNAPEVYAIIDRIAKEKVKENSNE